MLLLLLFVVDDAIAAVVVVVVVAAAAAVGVLVVQLTPQVTHSSGLKRNFKENKTAKSYFS